jgi:hypothetical protein
MASTKASVFVDSELGRGGGIGGMGMASGPGLVGGTADLSEKARLKSEGVHDARR